MTVGAFVDVDASDAAATSANVVKFELTSPLDGVEVEGRGREEVEVVHCLD